MSASSISQYPVNFTAKTYQDPARRKIKYRSRPLYDLWNGACKMVRDFGQAYLRNRVFYASSPSFKGKIDGQRLEKSRSILREIGGSSLVLKNPDGTCIEAMYFDVELFREIILGKGGHFIRSSDGNSYTLRSSDSELTELLTKMKLTKKPSSSIGYQDFVIPSSAERPSLLGKGLTGITILTQGNACIFEMDRVSIIDTLLSGQNCIAYNIRGTGRSEGKPTEEGTYQDIETIYQFLKFKGFRDDLITVMGFCLGSGQASELAKRYPINLALDRAFPSMSEMVGKAAAQDAMEKIIDAGYLENQSSIIKKTISYPVAFFVDRFILSYPVKENLKKVKGNVIIADAPDDEIIPEGTGDRLFAAASPSSSKVKSRLVLKDHGHNSLWELEYKEHYNDHLNKTRVLHDFGHTTPPSLVSRFASGVVEKVGQSSVASKAASGSERGRSVSG